MSNVRQVLAGILAGLISLVIIIGSLTLALAEGSTGVAILPPTITETPSPLPTVVPGAPTFTPSPIPQDTVTPTTTPTPSCPVPPGWEQITLNEGDDLAAIAQTRGISLAELLAENCMTSEVFLPDTILSVPPLTATATATSTVAATPSVTLSPTLSPTNPPIATSCVPTRPNGWTTYLVQSGDTLFALSQAYYTTIFALQQANCIFGTTIITGQTLFVPNVATRTPIPSVTPTGTNTPTATPTIPTDTPTITFTPTLTPTFTDTPTETLPPPSPTDTSTLPPPTPTDTPLPPSVTPIPSATPTP